MAWDGEAWHTFDAPKQDLNSLRDWVMASLTPRPPPVMNDGGRPKEQENVSLLWRASSVGSLTNVKRLVEQERVHVDKARADGRTPLYAASYNGHPEVVRYLLQMGASVELAMRDAWTPCVARDPNPLFHLGIRRMGHCWHGALGHQS